jgi:hypothetical protein
VRRDVYADLHAPPHSDAALVHQGSWSDDPDTGYANGGTFYLRAGAARPGGPAHWTHDEVWRRADRVRQLMAQPGGFSGKLTVSAAIAAVVYRTRFDDCMLIVAPVTSEPLVE